MLPMSLKLHFFEQKAQFRGIGNNRESPDNILPVLGSSRRARCRPCSRVDKRQGPRARRTGSGSQKCWRRQRHMCFWPAGLTPGDLHAGNPSSEPALWCSPVGRLRIEVNHTTRVTYSMRASHLREACVEAMICFHGVEHFHPFLTPRHGRSPRARCAREGSAGGRVERSGFLPQLLLQLQRESG